MTKEIEQAVSDFVASCGVSFSAVYIRETKREEWACDAWAIRFEKPGYLADFDFFTGLGHRSKIEDSPLGRLAANELKGAKRNSLAWEQVRAKFCKPQAPSAASVLHSIVLDSSAAHETFADWCANLGHDEDSRKAFAAYEQCQKNQKKLRGVFSRAQIETLSNLLQDY